MRRLDAREFHLSEYIFEARIGEGTLMGCSLRLQGGAGAQPSGMEHNVAGSSMLWALLNYLSVVDAPGIYLVTNCYAKNLKRSTSVSTNLSGCQTAN